MNTATLDQPAAAVTPPPLPPPLMPTDDAATFERFRDYHKEAQRLSAETQAFTAAESSLEAVRAKVNDCDDEQEARKLLKELSEAELNLKVKQIRQRRVAAAEDDAWLSAAKLAPYAICHASILITEATQDAWDEFYTALESTIDRTIRATMENTPGLTTRILGAAETLASIQPGIARANTVQRELEVRKHHGGGLMKHYVTYAAQAIDFAIGEIPAIRAESALTRSLAAAILACK